MLVYDLRSEMDQVVLKVNKHDVHLQEDAEPTETLDAAVCEMQAFHCGPAILTGWGGGTFTLETCTSWL